MRHPSIRELFDYWDERRGSRVAPDRSDIDPAAIRTLLADTFILAFDAVEGHPFRVAGTRVAALFGRELKGEAFTEIWTGETKPMVRDLVNVVAHEAIGIVAGVSAVDAQGVALDFELLALPLLHRGRTDARVMGALVPTKPPAWLGAATIGRLALGTMRYLGPQTNPAPRIVRDPPQGRVRRGLVVYDGGQLRAAEPQKNP
jgi:hypothetical protein